MLTGQSGRASYWGARQGCGRLTVEADVPVGQGQEWGVQGVVCVTENGVPLVDLLHHIRVEAVLLEDRGAGEAGQPACRHNTHVRERTIASVLSHT